jgi:hypothetical protein
MLPEAEMQQPAELDLRVGLRDLVRYRARSGAAEYAQLVGDELTVAKEHITAGSGEFHSQLPDCRPVGHLVHGQPEMPAAEQAEAQAVQT